MATLATALPEKTFLLTTKPLLVSGNATAPETKPAFSRRQKVAQLPLPLELLENTITFAPVCFGHLRKHVCVNLRVKVIQGIVIYVMNFFYAILSKAAKSSVTVPKHNSFGSISPV